VNIGVLAPYTGDSAVQGAISSAGCLAGIAPVNAAGGVLGARLACKPFDTKGDPADAVPAANQMLSSANPVMVIGPGDEAVATAPIVTAQQVTNFASIGDRTSTIRATPTSGASARPMPCRGSPSATTRPPTT
jgi:ABC-type branched-subunit amino acid transport system substrate-binding protein